MMNVLRGGTVVILASLFCMGVQSGRAQTQATSEKGPSMARGILQTQQALDSVNEMLRQNISDGDAFLNKYAFGLIAQYAGVIGLTKLQSDLESLQRADESTDAIQAGNYQVLVNNALKSLAEGYGDSPLPFSWLAKSGLTALDASTDFAEAYLLLRDRSQLLSIQQGLEDQLTRLEGMQIVNTGHAATLADFERLRNQDASFNKSLAQNGVQGNDVLAKATKDAQSVGKGALSAIARGVVVVDPEQSVWNLSKLPCVNPDFVAALAKGRNDVTGRHPVTRGYGDGVILPRVYYTSSVDPFSYIDVRPFNCDPGTPQSIVGFWDCLPGSYRDSQSTIPSLQFHDDYSNSKACLQISYVGPGHYKRGSPYAVGTDLYGSETRASAKQTVAPLTGSISAYGEEGEGTTQVDAWLSDGKLHFKETIVNRWRGGSGKVDVQNLELNLICIPSGP